MEVIAEKKIPPERIFCHDEFKEWPIRGRKRGGFRANRILAFRKGHKKVRQVHNARESFSAGLIIHPTLGVLRAYVLVKAANKAVKKQVKEKLGSLVDLITNSTGGMRGQTHVEDFLGKTVRQAVNRLRALVPEPLKQGPALLIEDRAPGHEGNIDRFLEKSGAENAKGWIPKRIEMLRSIDTYRALIPYHGTPHLCVNDQVHSYVHMMIRRELKNLVGLDLNLANRPKGEETQKFLTKRGPG